jgi:hypothetical protein
MCVTPGPNDRHVILAFKNPRVDNPAAVHEGLGVTAANCAEVLVEHGVNAAARPVVDGYYLRDRLRAEWSDATHVVLCAPYLDTPFLEGLCSQFPRIEFAVNYHSNVGFLQADNWAVKVMREQMQLEKRIPNFRLAGNSEKLCDSVERAFDAPCLLLPNLYYLHGPVERKRAAWSGPALHVGIFGATRQLKNMLTGAWASVIIGRELGAQLSIHVSEGREEGGKGVLKAVEQLIDGLPDVRLVREQWRPWLDFRRMMRRMHLLIQVSHTESFNGVTADGVAEGVPSVVSPAIDWVPSGWIANPDKACEIADVGKHLLTDAGAVAAGYRSLAGYNDNALECWEKFLGKIHRTPAPQPASDPRWRRMLGSVFHPDHA